MFAIVNVAFFTPAVAGLNRIVNVVLFEAVIGVAGITVTEKSAALAPEITILGEAAVKFKFADKPTNSTWPAFYAVSILTGIGFTMSLFVGNLAFANNMEYMDGVKIGVLAGSLLSTLFGYFLLLIFSKK